MAAKKYSTTVRVLFGSFGEKTLGCFTHHASVDNIVMFTDVLNKTTAFLHKILFPSRKTHISAGKGNRGLELQMKQGVKKKCELVCVNGRRGSVQLSTADLLFYDFLKMVDLNALQGNVT